MRRLALVPLLVLLALGPALSGQPKPPPKDAPRVLVAVPLGVRPGSTSRLVVRGLKLDTATAVRFLEATVTAKLLNKGKATVPPQQEPGKVGDTQIEIEMTVAAEHNGPASLVVVTPAGETPPHRILIDATPTVNEKEPNNGFKQAQPVQVPQIVQGSIGNNTDVDVFRIDGKAGQKLTLEIFAARYGSALDSILTLYDADGQILAVNDDHDGSPDSRLEVTLPRDGVYYVAVSDAHDVGGPAHVYQLHIRPR
jgi:hypothetical protein